MPAGYGQFYLGIRRTIDQHGKTVITVYITDVGRAHVRIGVQAKRADAAVQTIHAAHGIRIIPINNYQPIHRCQFDKPAERVDDIVQILEKVEMVFLNVEHNCNGRRKGQEGIAILAALRHKAPFTANAQRPTDGRQIAADHDGRVHLRLHCHQRHHRSRSGFAVRTCQADHVFIIAHQVSPCLSAFHHRNAQLVRASNFRVIIMHSGRPHDQRHTLHIFRLMLISDFSALGFEPRGDIGFQAIRTAYRHAATEQQLAQ